MVQLRCPKCATLVLAQPGETIRCPSCGFAAVAPGAAPASQPAPSSMGRDAPPEPTSAAKRHSHVPPIHLQTTRPPIETAAATEGEPLRVLSVWAFLIAFVALGTFHFARYGIPFVLGATAAVMGTMAFVKNKQDRHGLVATILGCVSLGIGAVYLALQ